MDDMQPGQIIIPHGPDDPKPTPGGSPEPERPPEQVDPLPQPPVEPDVAAPPASIPAEPPVSTTVDAPAATAGSDEGWTFRQEGSSSAASQIPASETGEDISWTASEFIAHDKGPGWYIAFTGGTIIGTILLYLITKDIISIFVVLFASGTLAYFSAHKPRTQHYTLTGQSLQIGQRTYNFQDFRSFSAGQEGAIVNIVFTPLKRFMPPLTIYLAPDVEEGVLSFLGNCLPFEQRQKDAVDSLLNKLRF